MQRRRYIKAWRLKFSLFSVFWILEEEQKLTHRLQLTKKRQH